MLHTEQLESKFLIRLPLNTFSKEIRAIKGNDKIISINLTNKYIRGFERENIKNCKATRTIRNKDCGDKITKWEYTKIINQFVS